MDLSLLNTSLIVLINKATTDPTPHTQLPQNESDMKNYTQVFICYLPEKLRGLQVLLSKYADLRITIAEHMKKTVDVSGDYEKLMKELECVEWREETIHSLILCELVLLEPLIAEHMSTCEFVSDWKVVDLIATKNKRRKEKSLQHNTLQ